MQHVVTSRYRLDNSASFEEDGEGLVGGGSTVFGSSSAASSTRARLRLMHSRSWLRSTMFSLVSVFQELNSRRYPIRASSLSSVLHTVCMLFQYLQLWALCMSAPDMRDVPSDSSAIGSWISFMEQILYFGRANSGNYTTLLIRLYLFGGVLIAQALLVLCLQRCRAIVKAVPSAVLSFLFLIVECSSTVFFFPMLFSFLAVFTCSVTDPTSSQLLHRDGTEVGMACVTSPHPLSVVFSVLFLFCMSMFRYMESISVYFGHAKVESIFDIGNPFVYQPVLVTAKLILGVIHFYAASSYVTGVFGLLFAFLMAFVVTTFLPFKRHFGNRFHIYYFVTLLVPGYLAFTTQLVSLYAVIPALVITIAVSEICLRVHVVHLLKSFEYSRKSSSGQTHSSSDVMPPQRGRSRKVHNTASTEGDVEDPTHHSRSASGSSGPDLENDHVEDDNVCCRRCMVMTSKWWKTVAVAHWQLDNSLQTSKVVPSGSERDTADVHVQAVHALFLDTVDTEATCAFLRMSAVEFVLSSISVTQGMLSMLAVHEIMSELSSQLEEMGFIASSVWMGLDEARRSLEQESASARIGYSLRKASKHQTKILKLTIAFWELLLQPNVTPDTLSNIVSQMEKEERAASRLYGTLLRSHSHNPAVLRSYAHFIELTSVDAGEARTYFELAEKYENGVPAVQKLKPMRDSIQALSQDATMGVIDGTRARKNPLTSAPRESVDLHSHDSSSHGLSREDDYEIREDMKRFLMQRSAAHKRMVCAVIMSLLFMLALAIVVYVSSLDALSISYAERIEASTRPAFNIADGSYRTRELEIALNNITTTGAFAAAQGRLSAVADVFDTNLKSLYQESWRDSDVMDGWKAQNAHVIFWNFQTNSATDIAVSVEEMFGIISRSLRTLSQATPASLLQSGIGNNTDFGFLVTNGPKSFFEAATNLVDRYTSSYASVLTTRRVVLYTCGALIVALPLLLLLVLYYPASKSIHKEKTSIHQLFLLIPKTDVSDILKSVNCQCNASECEMDDLEKPASTGNLDHTSLQPSAAGSAPSAGRTSSSGGKTRKSSSISTTGRKSRPAFFSLTVTFVLSLFIISLLLCLICGFSIGNTFLNYRYSQTLRYAATTRAYSKKLIMVLTELVRNDSPFGLLNQDAARAEIAKTVAEAKSVFEAVKYGSTRYETTGVVGQGSKSQRILFDDRCSDKATVTCAGLDSLFSMFATNIQYFLYYPAPLLSLHVPEYAMLKSMEESHLSILLSNLVNAIHDEEELYMQEQKDGVTFLFVFGILAIVLALILNLVMLEAVWREVRQNRKMMTMIPLPVIHKLPALEEFIQSHGTELNNSYIRQAVRESEEKTESILAASVDAVFGVTESGIIERASPSAEAMFGCPLSSLIGYKMTNFLGILRPLTTSSANSAVDDQSSIDMAVGGGRTELLASEVFEEMLLKSKGMNALSFETEASRWDGSKFPAQLSITVRRIQGDGFFAVFVRDLTSVRKQETLLRSERQRSDELLYTIVPRPIAVRLKRGEKPIYDEYSCISIIFIDLVGFTSMSSKMSARDLIVLLSDYFSTIDRIAATHSVEKVKLIGDCFLGMAGLYSRFNDHAQAMVEFAQDVMLMLNDFNQKHGTTLNCRIGINSGPCMVGVIGETKFQLDAYGDTVNIASRMESTGVPGRIQLSRNTYELVCDQVGCEERGTIQVKGKGDMVTYLVK